jgi:hypothetical protein
MGGCRSKIKCCRVFNNTEANTVVETANDNILDSTSNDSTDNSVDDASDNTTSNIDKKPTSVFGKKPMGEVDNRSTNIVYVRPTDVIDEPTDDIEEGLYKINEHNTYGSIRESDDRSFDLSSTHPPQWVSDASALTPQLQLQEHPQTYYQSQDTPSKPTSTASTKSAPRTYCGGVSILHTSTTSQDAPTKPISNISRSAPCNSNGVVSILHTSTTSQNASSKPTSNISRSAPCNSSGGSTSIHMLNEIGYSFQL